MIVPASKVLSIQEAVAWSKYAPRPLVMTNGVFDILHRGHVDYLSRASELGASLLVGLNSDASVRLLGKGVDRPFNKQPDRAYVLGGLAAVTAVTIFEESTPSSLVSLIKPDVYVKGGDYDVDKLDEARIVRGYGGRALALPFIRGFSTSDLVLRVRKGLNRKAVFLDRDGVINEDFGYVHKWEDFHFLPHAVEGIKIFMDAGYKVVVVTNQSGIARGLFSEEDFLELTRRMRAELAACGVYVDGVYYCPHYQGGTVSEYSIDCSCRKPSPGLITRALMELGLSAEESLLVGDKATDIQAARNAGLRRAYLVGAEKSEVPADFADGFFCDLISCAKAICCK